MVECKKMIYLDLQKMIYTNFQKKIDLISYEFGNEKEKLNSQFITESENINGDKNNYKIFFT